VRAILQAYGFRVKALGIDVSAEQILEEQATECHDVVCISCFLSTSALTVPKIIRRLKRRYPETVVMLGEAAIDAAEEARRLLRGRCLLLTSALAEIGTRATAAWILRGEESEPSGHARHVRWPVRWD